MKQWLQQQRRLKEREAREQQRNVKFPCLKQEQQEELKRPDQKLRTADPLGHLMAEEGEQDEYDRPYKPYFSYADPYNKKYSKRFLSLNSTYR